jgi:hypothetical protein
LVIGLLSCTAAAAAMSPDDEVKLGRSVMAELRPMGLTADPALAEIGQRMSQVVARKELPWTFWVIEDWHIYNAFAAPGGFVFITRTYFQRLNADEAAFVLGHEMAHVDLNHYERSLRRTQQANIGHAILNVLIGGQASTAWHTATDVGATAYMTHYSRALEKEADLTGYQYAEAAGYDARMAVTALSKLGEQPNLHPWIVNLYGTHPLITSREDRLAAMGGEEPDDIEMPGPSPQHRRDLTQGLAPLDPTARIAVRILAPDGKRWENPWRKNFTKHLHLRLEPLGFVIAGDDLMYKPDIGDAIQAAQSRQADYLLLVTVAEMSSTETGEAGLAGTPVRAAVAGNAKLVRVAGGETLWEAPFDEKAEGWDVLPLDSEMLYTDACVGRAAEKAAAEIALGCAEAAGAQSAPPEETGGQGPPAVDEVQPADKQSPSG